MKKVAILVVLGLFLGSVVYAGDYMESVLERAKERHKKEVKKENDKLIDVYERAIKYYTKKGKLDKATAVKEEKELFLADQGVEGEEDVADGGDNLLPTMTGGEEAKDGVKIVRDGNPLVSSQHFSPPIQIDIIGRTNATDFRIGYAAKTISFNWSFDKKLLRIDGGPADCEHKKGAGFIETNKDTKFTVIVTNNEMIIFVNNKKVHSVKADFSLVNENLRILTSAGSVLTVKDVRVRELKK